MINFPIFGMIATIATVISWSIERADQRIRFIGIFFICIVAAMIISNVHTADSAVYQDMWYQIDVSKGLFSQYNPYFGEPFYYLSQYLVKSIVEEFNYFRIGVIFFALFLKIVIISKLSFKNNIGIIFYFCIIFATDSYLIRGSLAGGLVCFGVYLLITRRSSFSFILCVFLASGFHVSALVSIPLIFVNKFKGSQPSYLIFFIILIFLSIIPIGHLSVTLFSNLFGADQFIANKMITYALTSQGDAVGIFRGSTIIYFLIFSLFIFQAEALKKISPHTDQIAFIMFYALLFLIGFSDFAVITDRLFRLFASFFAIGFSLLFFKFSDRSKVTALISVAILLNTLVYMQARSNFFLVD
jgi:hypothetical protein